MKIIYCCYGRAGIECFYQIVNTLNIKFDDIIVFTHDTNDNKDLISHLKHNKIKFFFDNINKKHRSLLKFNGDFLISVYYRYIINPKILKLINYKAMNLHPSLLPAYRGTKSSVWALINNEKMTGITFHYINKKIDEGKIILQKKIKIYEHDTAYSLYHKLISLFTKNFDKALIRLIKNYKGKKQKGKVSYYKRKLPFKGIRNFNEITYDEGKQFVKAMYFPGYDGALFKYKNLKKIQIRNVEDLKKFKKLFRKK